MRIRPTVALVLAAGLLVACSSGDDADGGSAPAAATSPAATTGAGAQLTEAQLDAALVSVSDLPTGWASTPYEDDDSTDDTPLQPTECKELLESLEETEDTTLREGGASFEKGGDFGTQLDVEVSTHTDVFPQARFDAAVAEMLDKCGTMQAEIEGATAGVTLAELSVPDLGDKTYGLQMDIDYAGMTLTSTIVMVGVGHNALMVTTAGLQPVEPAELEQVLQTAYANLEQAASDTSA